MTNSNDRTRWTDERLDQLASFIFANAEAIRESNESNAENNKELQQLTQSNSRTIQAILEAQATERLMNEEYRQQAAQERAELRQATLRLGEVAEGIANLLSSLDSDRPTILRRLRSIEDKVDRILDGGESQP